MEIKYKKKYKKKLNIRAGRCRKRNWKAALDIWGRCGLEVDQGYFSVFATRVVIGWPLGGTGVGSVPEQIDTYCMI